MNGECRHENWQAFDGFGCGGGIVSTRDAESNFAYAVDGAILVTTRQPENAFQAKLSGGVGNQDVSKVDASISGPLIEDTLFARQALSSRRDNGSYCKSLTGRDGTVDFVEDDSLRGRMVWNVNEDLTLDFRAGYSEVKGGASNYSAAFGSPQFLPM